MVLRPPTLADVMRAIAAELRAAGIETATDDARRLVALALGLAPGQLRADADRLLDKRELAAVDRLVARRLAHEPVTRITGERAFWNGVFTVTADVLDPRPDSEAVIEAVLAHVASSGSRGRRLRIADLGTGSGVLLISLLQELPQAVGIGIDISAAAAAVAQSNARRNGVAERALFAVGDWSQALSGSFDLVVSNPPYVRHADIAGLNRDVREFDPQLALDGGPDGLIAYRRIIADFDRVAAGGSLFLEIGHDQAAAVSALAATVGSGHRRITVSRDLAGRDRCVAVLAR